MIEKSLSKQECYVSKPKDKWGRVANNHEAIISKKDFEEVQKIKGKKVFLKGKNTDYPWRTKSPLQGFVKCPTCNHVLSLVQNKTSLEYIVTFIVEFVSVIIFGIKIQM